MYKKGDNIGSVKDFFITTDSYPWYKKYYLIFFKIPQAYLKEK